MPRVSAPQNPTTLELLLEGGAHALFEKPMRTAAIALLAELATLGSARGGDADGLGETQDQGADGGAGGGDDGEVAPPPARKAARLQ